MYSLLRVSLYVVFYNPIGQFMWLYNPIGQYMWLYNPIDQHMWLYNPMCQYMWLYNPIGQYMWLYNPICQYMWLYNPIDQYMWLYNPICQYMWLYNPKVENSYRILYEYHDFTTARWLGQSSSNFTVFSLTVSIYGVFQQLIDFSKFSQFKHYPFSNYEYMLKCRLM